MDISVEFFSERTTDISIHYCTIDAATVNLRSEIENMLIWVVSVARKGDDVRVVLCVHVLQA